MRWPMGKAPKTVKPRKRRLKTISDCCRANADVWNRLNREEIKPEIATKLCYIISIQQKMISVDDLEKRVESLEDEIVKK